ncbi:LytR C-terminal domain-containing protein [Mycobacterium sp. GA-1841]|uniref:LytR C-terminal domain-containing protein n=1 Tax=Mycobacterium sp. GA-1841 TaxID=1834154 RepID=UPI00111552FB|nr:LytR C-terminal domain-containing protein [Mycobacterium sp. GA-1841]
MNQRDSSGLPLRAMVMVLLFLGVVFLLVGFQALGSDDDSADQSSVATTSATTTAAKTSAKAEPAPEVKADVRVYNISDVAGAAETAANQLREARWNVTETGNLPPMEGIAGTTVFFGDTPDEKEAAENAGKVLHAPVEPRRPELLEQPPGVIVVVTG